MLSTATEPAAAAPVLKLTPSALALELVSIMERTVMSPVSGLVDTTAAPPMEAVTVGMMLTVPLAPAPARAKPNVLIPPARAKTSVPPVLVLSASTVRLFPTGRVPFMEACVVPLKVAVATLTPIAAAMAPH